MSNPAATTWDFLGPEGLLGSLSDFSLDSLLSSSSNSGLYRRPFPMDASEIRRSWKLLAKSSSNCSPSRCLSAGLGTTCVFEGQAIGASEPQVPRRWVDSGGGSGACGLAGIDERLAELKEHIAGVRAAGGLSSNTTLSVVSTELTSDGRNRTCRSGEPPP